MVIGNLIFFIISCIVLIYSGTWLVKSLVKVASFLKMNEFIVSFIIMAFATSLPELFVGINSALTSASAISLGNVLGSNIANLSLVLGIAIVFSRGIKVGGAYIRKDSWLMFGIMFLPLILMYLGRTLSRLDGIILLVVLGFYFWRVILRRKRYSKKFENNIRKSKAILYTAMFIFSLIVLFVSSNFVVKYASLLSIDFALPPILIGLFLVALGTSLPELVFSVRSGMLGHQEFIMGNLIGSVIINATLVLGITALIMPITANLLLFLTSTAFMIVIGFLFITFTESSRKLDLKEGVSLILVYILFIIVQFYIHNLGGVI